MNLNLQTRVGKFQIEGVIGNAPGPRKSIEESHEVGRSPASIITLGSLTTKERMGNAGVTYWTDGQRPVMSALNSIGLTNPGVEAVLEGVNDLKSHGKPVIISLAAEFADDFVEMAAMFADRGFGIELNLTCPNVAGYGIFAYDLSETARVVSRVRHTIGEDNLIVKLNPSFDDRYIEEMCAVLVGGGVDAIALSNTVPYSLIINQETLEPEISPMTLGGLSGKSIHPIVMGQVFKYRRFLREMGSDLSIICEGGIWSGFDIFAYFMAGGNFCRIATMYAEVGPRVFEQLLTEFISEMEKRGITSVSDIPKLRELTFPISKEN